MNHRDVKSDLPVPIEGISRARAFVRVPLNAETLTHKSNHFIKTEKKEGEREKKKRRRETRRYQRSRVTYCKAE